MGLRDDSNGGFLYEKNISFSFLKTTLSRDKHLIWAKICIDMIIGDFLNLFLGTELKMRKMKMVDLNIYF